MKDRTEFLGRTHQVLHCLVLREYPQGDSLAKHQFCSWQGAPQKRAGVVVEITSTSVSRSNAARYKNEAFADILWGRSSAGRAPALQAGGQEFDSPRLHQNCSLSFAILV